MGPEHDAVADFTLNSNPNGPWTYLVDGSHGDKALGSPATDYKQVRGLNAWTDGKTAGDAAYIARDVAPKPLHYGWVVLHKNQLLLHAGGSIRVWLRYIIPSDGLYRLKVELEGIDKRQRITGFYIHADGDELCQGSIQSYGEVADCRRTVTLKAGEKINVIVASYYPGDDARSEVGLIERIKGPIQKAE